MLVVDELKKGSEIDEQKTSEIEQNCFTLTQDLENAKAKVRMLCHGDLVGTVNMLQNEVVSVL